MSQRNIGNLPPSPAGYRVDRETARDDDGSRFETKRKCIDEDRFRCKLLNRAIKKYPAKVKVAKAKKLAVRLARSGKPNGRQRLSSSAYFRRKRRRAVGWLWYRYDKEVAAYGEGAATTFTLIPATWEFKAGQLWKFDPVKKLKALRVDLHGKGAAAAGGWLFAFVHGEFDPQAQVYRMHVHGLASREMVPILDKLRKVKRYKSVKFLPDGTPSPVFRRLWIRRLPLVNLPAPLTYLIQSWWPSRPITFRADGTRNRMRQKRRIPEPYHSEVLLWLDQFGLKDLSLLIGLRATCSGLVKNR